jgi:predicted nucleotidyltransferase
VNAQTIDYAKLQKQVDAHPYPLVLATISGAHLYGFPSADSDLLNETAKLPYINELVQRKLEGSEKGRLDMADLEFHEREFERLVAELDAAMEKSTLTEQATGKTALNDLLVRLRIIDREVASWKP